MSLKKLRCEKKYGVWFYEVLTRKNDPYLDGPVYLLYNSSKEYISSFMSLNDIKYYIETGIII